MEVDAASQAAGELRLRETSFGIGEGGEAVAGLETESRNLLTGHEGGNAGYSQGSSYGFTHQRSTLPRQAKHISEIFVKQFFNLIETTDD